MLEALRLCHSVEALSRFEGGEEIQKGDVKRIVRVVLIVGLLFSFAPITRFGDEHVSFEYYSTK